MAAATDDRRAMAMQPAADGSIVIAGHEVFTASQDGGQTWQPIASDLPNLDIHGFARDPAEPARMWAYLATGGLWESVDAGARWTRVRDDNVLFPLAAGQSVNIALTSSDILHDLTVDEIDFHVAADTGERVVGGMVFDEPGTYVGYCSVPGHREAGMELEIVVTAAG